MCSDGSATISATANGDANVPSGYSQAYVLMTGLGKSLFDYHSAQVLEHQADWAPLLKWLKKAG